MADDGEAKVRAAVHRAWAEMLPGAELDERLTWQEAGVDSLKSLHLLLRIEQTLGRAISFDLLTRDTRIAELIAIIAGKPAPAATAPRRGLLVPPIYGDGPMLAELRAALRDDIAFTTLALPDLADPIAVGASLDATAAFLADQLPDAASGDPLILAGYSFGAYAAIATARVLEARGARIALLCLFDPLPGRPPSGPVAAKLRRQLARLRALAPDRSSAATLLVRGLLAARWIAAARHVALRSGATRGDPAVEERRRNVLSALRARALRGWRPARFDGRTILFATDESARAGDHRRYRQLLPDLTIVPVGGEHLEIFRGEPLRTIVATLRGVLDELSLAQAATSAASARKSGL